MAPNADNGQDDPRQPTVVDLLARTAWPKPVPVVSPRPLPPGEIRPEPETPLVETGFRFYNRAEDPGALAVTEDPVRESAARADVTHSPGIPRTRRRHRADTPIAIGPRGTGRLATAARVMLGGGR